MSRRRRVSRALIGILCVTMALGLMFWLHNLTKTDAAPHAQANTPQLPPPPIGARTASSATPVGEPASAGGTASARPTALVTQTPTAAPKTLVTATPTAQPATPSHPQPIASPATKPTATPSAAASSSSIADAKSKLDAGDFLTARNLLNASLATGKLSESDVKAVKQLLNKVNDTVVFSPRKFADDTVAQTYVVKRGDSLQRIARQHESTAELIARVNGITDPRKLREGQTIKVVTGPFQAVVDKSDFTLEVWLGSPGESGAMYVTSFPVGLGKDDSTPTGTWIVETQKKIRNPTYFSPRGEGVIEADDPDNPLGEYWIGLTGTDGQAVGKQSYGIHGTIRPDSIGKQESMGCVRLVNDDVAKVFEMLVEGKSMVVIRD